MKLKFCTFLSVLFILCAQIASTQGINKTESLDSILRKIKDPKEKVDVILNFLGNPQTQYLENKIDIASRAYSISKQSNYAIGEVRAMILLGHYYLKISDYKKALDFTQKSREMSEDLNFDKELADALSLLGTIYTDFDDYDKSSQYFFMSLDIYEKLENKIGISQSLGDIGMVFYYQQNYKKAFSYFNKALLLAKEINSQSAIKRQYNNIAVVYGNLLNYDSSIFFLKKALEINIQLGDKLGQGTNILNIGYDQMNQGKYEQALSSFNQCLVIFNGINNHINIALSYINIGFCYLTSGNSEKSIPYFKKALDVAQKNNFYRIISPAAKTLNQIYAENKDTIQAYKYAMIEILAGDSLFSSQKQELLSKLELQYTNEKNEFEKEKAQNAKSNIMFIIMLALVSGMVILGLILSRYKIKSKLVNTEKEKIQLEKEKIESELKNKDRELTVNLISLIKKNEMISGISDLLLQLKMDAKSSEVKDVILKISQELRNSTDDKIFNEFTTRFQEVHAGFYEKLLKTYPDLTQNELKLCAFLRLNMTTKEIAELTGQQMTSIDKARYRLRKKLAINSSEVNLVTFLTQV
jgi:tetratricopeptide (TPR) repeat protein